MPSIKYFPHTSLTPIIDTSTAYLTTDTPSFDYFSVKNKMLRKMGVLSFVCMENEFGSSLLPSYIFLDLKHRTLTIFTKIYNAEKAYFYRQNYQLTPELSAPKIIADLTDKIRQVINDNEKIYVINTLKFVILLNIIQCSEKKYQSFIWYDIESRKCRHILVFNTKDDRYYIVIVNGFVAILNTDQDYCAISGFCRKNYRYFFSI